MNNDLIIYYALFIFAVFVLLCVSINAARIGIYAKKHRIVSASYFFAVYSLLNLGLLIATVAHYNDPVILNKITPYILSSTVIYVFIRIVASKMSNQTTPITMYFSTDIEDYKSDDEHITDPAYSHLPQNIHHIP